MRERDLKALEFDKVMALVTAMAASGPAREALTRLRPALASDEARVRLRAVAELVELRAHAGALPVGEFADLRPLLLTAAREGAVLDGPALVQIRDFTAIARQAAAFMRSRVEHLTHLSQLAGGLLAPRELADALNIALADDGALLDDASAELSRLRRRLRAERVELEARLLHSLSGSGMEPFVADHLVTIRNRRFVLPMKPNYGERFEGIVQDRSVSGETLFVEPLWAIELNNRLMMLEREAESEERRILARLTAMVRGYGQELKLTFDAMVELDALNARALFAERFSCVEPEMGEGIELIAARHPLLMASGREAVPIDVAIAPGQRGIVISGPNTGGKTVALKTIGLLSLMAQTGLMIPAGRGSKLTAFRSIFADIGDEQSIEANLSSFSAHIANLTEIVAQLAEPALVVLDEPGAGTDPAEGAALAIGLMNHLATRHCVVAIATHSTAVKLYAYSRAGFDAAAVDFDPQRLVPLYRLKPHTIGQSYGLRVARRLGLSEEILKGAEAAMPAGSLELERALGRLEEERRNLSEQVERLRIREGEATERERAAREAAERAQRKAEAERARLREKGDELLAELKRGGAEVLDELRARRKSGRDLARFAEIASQRLDTVAPPEKSADEADDRPIRVGDQVALGDIRGELVALEAGHAVVSRGGLRIEVAPERLRRAASPPPLKRREPPRVALHSAASDEPELDLIGMRTGDALRRLESFLDQAYLTSRSEVRIIHGVGSGALKKAIHEYLSNSPYCAGFHLAEPHRGGAGATVVQLNS